MSVLGSLHTSKVHDPRVAKLSVHIAELIAPKSTVLDVGCGDGLLSRILSDQRPDLAISGVDVLVRPETKIPVVPFDGHSIPFPDNSFDVVMFVDVLHHTDDPMVLLKEAARTARRSIVLKDHCRNGVLANTTLRFMDWVGNARYGVALPYNYWTKDEWDRAFMELKLEKHSWTVDLRLYPKPADWLFGRSLHFIAQLGTKVSG